MQEFLYWFLVAILCFIVEIFTFTTFFLFIGLSLLAMSGVVYVFPEMNHIHQALVFVFFSLLVVFAFYKFGLKNKKSESQKLDVNDRMSTYIGKTVTAIEDSQNGIIKVSMGDTVWRAKINIAKKGDKLKVVGFESTSLVCETF